MIIQKKILFLLFISVLLLIPFANASATQMYVGVQINSAQAPGCTPGTSTCPGTATDNNWCLPVGTTDSNSSKMVVATTASCSHFDSNTDPTNACSWCSGVCLSTPVSVVKPTCSGDTIWSGLVDVTNGVNYKIYLWTPNFCPGYINGQCFVTAATEKNCCDVCNNYGLTARGGESNCTSSTTCYIDSSPYDDANCTREAKLKGSACSSCAANANYAYFDDSGNCFTSYNAPWPSYQYGACNWTPASNQKRVCECNFPNNGSTGFNFTFTASF